MKTRDPAPMVLTLGVWLCALPFVLLLIGPLLGLKGAALVVGGLLAALALLCWSVCAVRAEAP